MEKRGELAIPMERLLACYVMEQLAVKLAASERGERLLLKNPGVLGLHGLDQGSCHRLYYVYVRRPDEIFCKADFAVFLKSTIKWETETNINWSWRSRMEGDRLVVELLAVLDDMRMPVELIVDPVEEGSFDHPATDHPLRLVMENNKTCQIAVYPALELFYDDLGEVLSKLELIGDMGAYARIYEALGELDFEGRSFQKSLGSFCSRHGIVMDELRYAQMERYFNYPYMEKKWRSYAKKQGSTAISWQEVYGRFWKFLMPPWSASLQGMVYLGSWISDLGRYLD